jgi:hypothetical protein
MDKKRINRREFLVSTATAAGVIVPGVAWPAGRPCPPPTLGVSGGTTAPTTCVRSGPGQLPKLVLTSRSADGAHAWTFGHPFRQGDVPSGSVVTAEGDVFQMDVRNRWPDGSVKFAVLSGITSLTRNSPKPIALTVASGNDGPTTFNVAEPTALDVSITFSGSVSGTYTLQSALGVNKETWGSRAGAGRVRRILGPVMSEFHYYVPTSDDHVAVWFYVRHYSNGATEVETVVENGWLLVPAPGQREYTVTLAIAGRTRYTGTLSHLHHTRWSRADWVGPDPQIVPKHDPSYLRRTRLVPNYGYTAPRDAAFSSFASDLNPVPFAQGNWATDMFGTGAHPAIGLLPKWEALYCTSADPRAYVAMISNNRGAGRYGIHYRDETTGRIPRYMSYKNNTLTSGWGANAPRGGPNPPVWDIAHHPSLGYLAYLVTGRWLMLEELQFSASSMILETNPVTRYGGGVLALINAPLTERGAAWAWRTMGQAAAVSPTQIAGGAPLTADSSMQEQWARSIDDTAAWNRARYVDGTIDGGLHRNTLGWLGAYVNYNTAGGSIPRPPSEFWGPGWMQRFQNIALGHISDLGIEGLASPANLAVMRDHSYEGVLRLIGDDSSWNWRRAVTYAFPYLKNGSKPASPVFMSTSESFASYRATLGISALSAAAGGTLKQHSTDLDITSSDSSNVGTGYGAVVAAALAMAVDHGMQGARAKYALFTSASNFDTSLAHDDPNWAIVPR